MDHHQNPIGRWKAQVRRIGLSAVSKTFKTKYDAEVLSRPVESEQDRGVFVNRSEADSITIGELIDRCIQEVTLQKRSAKNDWQGSGLATQFVGIPYTSVTGLADPEVASPTQLS